jgi:hypothetical protein
MTLCLYGTSFRQGLYGKQAFIQVHIIYWRRFYFDYPSDDIVKPVEV